MTDLPDRTKRQPASGKAGQKPKEKKPYIPRLSESYFFNSALYYLQRYASTQANLQQVLQRKVLRAKQRGAVIPPETGQWITLAVEKCVRLGYINDRFYAESKITSMRREGRSARFIQQTLYQKGVPADIAAQALQDNTATADMSDNHHGDDDQNAELQSALRTIRRRNLVRADKLALMDTEQRRDHYQKNLARLLRAGFPMQIARQALDSALDSHKNTALDD